MSQKRKKVVVSVEKKLEAIGRLDKGEMIRNVAADYGVGKTTVGDWRRYRSQLEQFAKISGNAMTSRKTMKPAEYYKVDKGLFLWFIQMREKGLPISGPILQAKAMRLAKKFPDESHNFTASCGWLYRWKKRHGIRNLGICGKKLSTEVGLTNIKKEFEKPAADVDRNNIEKWNHTGDDSQQELTDDKRGHLVNSRKKIADDVEENKTEPTPRVSHEEGLNALQIALKYIKEQPESNESDLLLLKRWRDIAAKKQISKLKQCSIKDFFKPL